jgi:6-pyruvoyltetrahydropterin/6-carboxytetrahydropterin synthase
MYEVGLSVSFNAWHVMPEMEGPEGELHQHDYRMEVVASRAELDDRGMVCDLDVMVAALNDIVAKVEGQDLEIIRPPDAEAVTVELLATWGHRQLADALKSTGVETLSIRVWESPVAFGGYVAGLASTSS